MQYEYFIIHIFQKNYKKISSHFREQNIHEFEDFVDQSTTTHKLWVLSQPRSRFIRDAMKCIMDLDLHRMDQSCDQSVLGLQIQIGWSFNC